LSFISAGLVSVLGPTFNIGAGLHAVGCRWQLLAQSGTRVEETQEIAQGDRRPHRRLGCPRVPAQDETERPGEAMRTVKEVMPIRSDAEYQQVLGAIQAASDEAASDERVLALRQRAQAYEQRLRIDPERLRALAELAAQAQDLKMGYE